MRSNTVCTTKIEWILSVQKFPTCVQKRAKRIMFWTIILLTAVSMLRDVGSLGCTCRVAIKRSIWLCANLLCNDRDELKNSSAWQPPYYSLRQFEVRNFWPCWTIFSSKLQERKIHHHFCSCAMELVRMWLHQNCTGERANTKINFAQMFRKDIMSLAKLLQLEICYTHHATYFKTVLSIIFKWMEQALNFNNFVNNFVLTETNRGF